MSAAIMQSAAFYDFGDLLLKNPNGRSKLNHLAHQQTQQIANTNATGLNAIGSPVSPTAHMPIGINSNTTTTTTTNSRNFSSVQNMTVQQQQQAQATVAAAATALHNQLAVLQQQQQQKILLHNALNRTVSHQPGANDVVSLMNTLMDFGHRKLERTQSEPLPQVNTSRYKTELCRPFEEAGECKYGEKCQFAHGMHELRNLQRHPKYKTELCRTFHSSGFCPYGPRCHFVHNVEEARNHNRAVHAAMARAAIAAGHPIPMSPPLSMTGSDRASPSGSLSLSPTNSLANFQFTGIESMTAPQQSQHMIGNTVAHPMFTNSSTIQNSPPASPPAIAVVSQTVTATTPTLLDETRLPIFNQLSGSTLVALQNLTM